MPQLSVRRGALLNEAPDQNRADRPVRTDSGGQSGSALDGLRGPVGADRSDGPVAKSYLERLSKPVLEWGGKLLFFLLALTVGRSALHLLLFPELPAVLVYLGGSAVFLAYDFGLSQMAVRLNKF